MTVQPALRAAAAVGDFLPSGFPMKDQILFVKSTQYELNNIGDIPRRSHHPGPRFVVSAFSSTVADLTFILPFLTTSFSPISLLIVSFFQWASQCIPYSVIMTTCLLQLAHGWSVQRLINSWMWLWTTAVKSKCLTGVLWRVYRGSATEPKRWSWAKGQWTRLAVRTVPSLQTPVLCPGLGESCICTGWRTGRREY